MIELTATAFCLAAVGILLLGLADEYHVGRGE